MKLKRKLFKVNGCLDSILSPMNLDLLLPSLICFSPQEHPPRMVNPCWSSFFLPCFHFLFLLRRKSVAYLGFNIKLQLLKLNLWSPSWSGNTASVVQKRFDQPKDVYKILISTTLEELGPPLHFSVKDKNPDSAHNLVKNSILY